MLSKSGALLAVTERQWCSSKCVETPTDVFLKFGVSKTLSCYPLSLCSSSSLCCLSYLELEIFSLGKRHHRTHCSKCIRVLNLEGSQLQGQGSFSTLGKETPSFFRAETFYIMTSWDRHFSAPLSEGLCLPALKVLSKMSLLREQREIIKSYTL